MRVRITDIGEMSMFYGDRKKYIGKCADIAIDIAKVYPTPDWYMGDVKFLSPALQQTDHIHGFKFEKLTRKAKEKSCP